MGFRVGVSRPEKGNKKITDAKFEPTSEKQTRYFWQQHYEVQFVHQFSPQKTNAVKNRGVTKEVPVVLSISCVQF